MERDRFVGPRLAGIPVKRHGGRRDLNGICARLRGARRLQADLDFPGATDLPRVRNKIARLGAERVVALSLFSVHDDGDVFEQIPAAFLELRRAGRLHGINRPLPLDFGIRKLIRTLLDRRRHGGRRLLLRLARHPNIPRIHPRDNRGQQSRRRERPPRVFLRFAVPHLFESLEDLDAEYRGRVGGGQPQGVKVKRC